MSNSSSDPKIGATTPGQSGPGGNGNEGVFHIPQGLPSDCLMSYSGHSKESYLSAEMQSV